MQKCTQVMTECVGFNECGKTVVCDGNLYQSVSFLPSKRCLKTFWFYAKKNKSILNFIMGFTSGKEVT